MVTNFYGKLKRKLWSDLGATFKRVFFRRAHLRYHFVTTISIGNEAPQLSLNYWTYIYFRDILKFIDSIQHNVTCTGIRGRRRRRHPASRTNEFLKFFTWLCTYATDAGIFRKKYVSESLVDSADTNLKFDHSYSVAFRSFRRSNCTYGKPSVALRTSTISQTVGIITFPYAA